VKAGHTRKACLNQKGAVCVSYQPIENYGIIGNMHAVALVGMNGSIDFMYYPLLSRFLSREGAFGICSFWYVECLERTGDLDKARFFFEKMLGYANHLGLYAEELGPHGEHLGNFFTHLALISAAHDLDRRLSEAGWKA